MTEIKFVYNYRWLAASNTGKETVFAANRREACSEGDNRREANKNK